MKFKFQVKETILNVVCDVDYVATAKDAVFDAREIVERKIADDPFFKITYEPYPEGPKDDDLIRRMCRASVSAGVGPMAGVAGAVATYVAERMVEAGAETAIVENGGDIAFRSSKPVPIGLFADHNTLKNVAFMMQSDKIIGVCSSSAKIGPSVSLGSSNVCTVFSDDVILADCCATALGNKSKDVDSMSSALEEIGSIEGVDGCFASVGDMVGMFGDIPEMVRTSDIDVQWF